MEYVEIHVFLHILTSAFTFQEVKCSFLSPPSSPSCSVLDHMLSIPPCRPPHAPPKEWSECPHYSTDRPNECFFNENHTSIWTYYSVQLRSRDRAILYDENLFHVQDIGELTASLPTKLIKNPCTFMWGLPIFHRYFPLKSWMTHRALFHWEWPVPCSSPTSRLATVPLASVRLKSLRSCPYSKINGNQSCTTYPTSLLHTVMTHGSCSC